MTDEPFTRIDHIKVSMAMPLPQVVANIKANTARGLSQVTDLPEWREQMPIALAAGGPSIKETLPELRRFVNVMAAGSAHDWVQAQGIRPKWAIVSDPDAIMANYLRNPCPDTTYLIASQCDAAVFDALAGYRVATWHCGDSEHDTSVWGPERKIMIGGGCTVGTRAMIMAMCLGFWNQHLFGYDSCIRPDAHHAYDYSTPDEQLGTVRPIKIGGPNGREFMMASYMVGQLFDFKQIIDRLGHKLRVTVHGDGVLAELMKQAGDLAKAA